MGFLKKYFSQTRKPEGLPGKIMLSTMNSGHAKLADWGMGHLSEISPKEIIDIKTPTLIQFNDLPVAYLQAG